MISPLGGDRVSRGWGSAARPVCHYPWRMRWARWLALVAACRNPVGVPAPPVVGVQVYQGNYTVVLQWQEGRGASSIDTILGSGDPSLQQACIRFVAHDSATFTASLVGTGGYVATQPWFAVPDTGEVMRYSVLTAPTFHIQATPQSTC